MDEYSEKSIQILKGLEAVRKRPGMYIGSTGLDGLHHLLYEVLDNSIDEAMNGHCNKIIIELHKDGSVSVEDNGRGIPVGIHPDEGVPAVQVVLSKLHAGGKFSEGSYKSSGGLHGVGVSCVNALSKSLEVTVWREGQEYFQTYERGLNTSELIPKAKIKKKGTKIRFWPDPEIFTDTTFNPGTIANRIKELSFLNPRVSFIFKHGKEKLTFKSEKGLVDYIEHLAPGSGIGRVITCNGSDKGVYVDVALKWSGRSTDTELSFCNNINTHEGGTHLAGFRVALSNAVMRNVLKDIKAKCKPIPEDVKEGLTSIVSVRVPQPQFEGQTKTKLGTASVKGIVQKIVYEKLTEIFIEDAKLAGELANRIILTAKAREAAQRAREGVRKAANLGSDMLPGKLADCQSSNPEETELFIVEGNSAGGSAKQGRDRRFQAILPLRGKVLNIEGMSIAKALKSKEIQIMVAAIGAGIGAAGFNITNLRYGKVIIMTDADVDGCLSGDTRVKLLNGTYPSMEELARLYPNESSKFWVWANDGNGKHVPALAHSARITRHVNKIYEVKLDDGAVIRATENHPFMLRTGEFVRADQLVAGMSLMRMSWRLNGENGYNRNREDYNHKVESVRMVELSEPIPVYDLTVDGYHNFLVCAGDGSGVFVHNSHIRALILTFLFRQMPELIMAGNVYIAQPPLYKVKVGRRETFYYNDPGLKEALAKLPKGVKPSISRYKGLGEMPPKLLWETTMNPAYRKLLKVKLEDAATTDDIFVRLMGNTPESRADFIYEHALNVSNLDV